MAKMWPKGSTRSDESVVSELPIQPEMRMNLMAKSSYAPSAYSGHRSNFDDLIHTIITIPPDGGWGWIVVSAAFVANFVADGAMYTFGIFLSSISKTFGVHATTIAIGSSLMTGFYYLTGPLTCALVNRCGFQIIGFLGGLLAASAFIIASEVNSVGIFLAVFGMVGGFGFGMVYVPSIIVIGFYFERWRALATSVAVTGSAAGIMGFPIIMNLLDDLSWQWKFKVIAGGCIVVSFLAFTYRPLKPIRVVTRDKQVIQYLPDVDSIESLHEEKKQSFFKKLFKRFHNVAYPTAAQVHETTSSVMLNMSSEDNSSEYLGSVPEESDLSVIVPITTPSKGLDNKLSTVYEGDGRSKCKKCCYKFCKPHCRKLRRNRPMYRDDIFYTGSLNWIPHYSKTSQRTTQSSKFQNMEYHMSVTRVRTQRDQLEEKSHWTCCPESVVRTLVTMLSLNLLKSPSFLFLALSGFFTMLGMYVPFIYMIERARETGLDKSFDKHLFTALGAANAVGRIISGIISIIPHTKPLVVSYVSLFICGSATMASYFAYNAIGHFSYIVVFGLTIACLASLRAPIVVEMLGLENLTNAFGIILLFQGVAALIGLPLAGVIQRLANSYNMCFIFSGSCIIISAIMLIPIKHLSEWEKMRMEKKNLTKK